MREDLSWLSSTLASDASEGVGVLPHWIGTSKPSARVVAPARVVTASRDDNGVISELIASSTQGAGGVLMVGGHERSHGATIGGLMARELRLLGFVGLVTDGLVRDANDIRALDFPVWCRGVTPMASQKRELGLRGGAVQLGGVIVREGDLIVADDDGVVCWEAAQVDAYVLKARARLERDEQRLGRILERERR